MTAIGLLLAYLTIGACVTGIELKRYASLRADDDVQIAIAVCVLLWPWVLWTWLEDWWP